jgi:hypothetical protein
MDFNNIDVMLFLKNSTLRLYTSPLNLFWSIQYLIMSMLKDP